jgi:hypothetical protein
VVLGELLETQGPDSNHIGPQVRLTSFTDSNLSTDFNPRRIVQRLCVKQVQNAIRPLSNILRP